MWPIQSMGKFTPKTNMTKMRAVLLDRSLGFTTHAPSSQQPSNTVPEVRERKGSPEPDTAGGSVSGERPIPPSDGDGNRSSELLPSLHDALTSALFSLADTIPAGERGGSYTAGSLSQQLQGTFYLATPWLTPTYICIDLPGNLEHTDPIPYPQYMPADNVQTASPLKVSSRISIIMNVWMLRYCESVPSWMQIAISSQNASFHNRSASLAISLRSILITTSCFAFPTRQKCQCTGCSLNPLYLLTQVFHNPGCPFSNPRHRGWV
jgi:hypothetical protein